MEKLGLSAPFLHYLCSKHSGDLSLPSYCRWEKGIWSPNSLSEAKGEQG